MKLFGFGAIALAVSASLLHAEETCDNKSFYLGSYLVINDLANIKGSMCISADLKSNSLSWLTKANASPIEYGSPTGYDHAPCYPRVQRNLGYSPLSSVSSLHTSMWYEYTGSANDASLVTLNLLIGSKPALVPALDILKTPSIQIMVILSVHGNESPTWLNTKIVSIEIGIYAFDLFVGEIGGVTIYTYLARSVIVKLDVDVTEFYKKLPKEYIIDDSQCLIALQAGTQINGIVNAELKVLDFSVDLMLK
ncbi:hypothetical protein CCR75_006176 [Bremia lactucae]|uniref:Uncharacterized protein n=1 Tax=Bremia lactucae TaxID=4779 RepID=A0A976FI31_BRELC|nr:hypothetical protein CCR75_006176 [Bremia lactucae]